MLLTCPNCRSGLQVPDGTTAMVRCPACKTVFSPAAGLAPPEPEEDEREEKPRKRKPAREEDEDERPRKKPRDEEPEEENRDFDPPDERPRRKRRQAEEDELTPEERAARRGAFERAAWGCRLISISFGLFILSMMLIIVFFFQAVFFPPSPLIVVAAGVLGLVNWVLAAIGVGLCLSGPRAPGHWGYGISAAVAVAVHAIFLTAVVARGNEFSVGQTGHDEELDGVVRWGLVPTRIDATMFYLTAICYPDEQGAIPKGSMVLSMITGVAEMTRTVLIMMLLSCLSRAALDEDLAHKCTRAAGVASGAPGLLALGMLAFIAALVETNATVNLFTVILLLVVMMGTYSVLAGVIFPAFLTAREVTDACEEPFQSLVPKL